MKIIDKLTSARIGLLIKEPFFGNMATRMKLIESDEWLPTAATDGKNFYYNSSFVEALSLGELEFLFAHEIMHAILDHIARIGSRDPRKSNRAMDYAVNQILVDNKIGTPITVVKPLQDDKYRGLTWEEIYDLLDEDESSDNGGSVIDQHLSSEESSTDSGESPTISEETLKEVRSEIREAMIQSAEVSAGNVPSEVQRYINKLTKPKLDWKEILHANVQSLIKSDYSFTRVNRRTMHSGAVLPGMTEEERIELTVAIDTSGSIRNDDLTTFISEVKGILDQYRSYKIDLWCFDTQIHNHVTIENDSIDSIENYVPQGNGGTNFDVNFDYMKQKDITPNIFVMFTDGYPFGSWGDSNYCDTIFILKNNKNTVAPFGQTLYYEDSAS